MGIVRIFDGLWFNQRCGLDQQVREVVADGVVVMYCQAPLLSKPEAGGG